MKKLKQFLCGLFTHHSFYPMNTKCKYNEKDRTFTITETCSRCGKVFSFTASEKAFGLGE